MDGSPFQVAISLQFLEGQGTITPLGQGDPDQSDGDKSNERG